jgi:outer membrane lipoprotein SlyB
MANSAKISRAILVLKDLPARMALNLSGCKNRKVVSESNVFERIRNERAPLTEFSISGKSREVTLDEARTDLAKAVGAIAHTLFSKSYGPLVGTVTTTSVETILKNAESNTVRAKGDAKILVEELSARMFKEKT